jgi:hypothetical protein
MVLIIMKIKERELLRQIIEDSINSGLVKIFGRRDKHDLDLELDFVVKTLSKHIVEDLKEQLVL